VAWWVGVVNAVLGYGLSVIDSPQLGVEAGGLNPTTASTAKFPHNTFT
jgi:hypothetical protein